MAKEIDFILNEEPSEKDILDYPYSMEAYEYGKPSGGCRTRNKDDLRAMYQMWKEIYASINLKYIFKKGDRIIDI